MSPFHLIKARSIALVLSWLCAQLVLSGCGILPSVTDKAVAALDRAIVALESANADWQQILKDVSKDLPAELQSTIGFEVSRTLNRAVNATGSEVKCIVDFLHDRVREDLIRIKARLLHQTIPPLSPVFCDIESVDMAMVNDGRQNNLLIYGYNFDIENPVRIVLVENGQEVDVNEQRKTLFVLTHYKMELNLAGNGVKLSPQSEHFVIRWQDQVISEIPIKQPELPQCEIKPFKFVPSSDVEFVPPHIEGDRDFEGHGPKVSVDVRLRPLDFFFGGTKFGLEIRMHARETESDWTTAAGVFLIENFFSIPQGYVVNNFITPFQNSAEYTDNDHEDDEIAPSSFGPANGFSFVGDTDGSEAGTRTKVKVHLNPIELEIRQVDNCR